MEGKSKKRILWLVCAAAAFFPVLVYEFLTPILSDDLSYYTRVRQASSLAAVFAQEVDQYLSWTGRSIAHLMLRIYLYIFGLNRGVFNVLAAVVFTLMILCMYGLLVSAEENRGLSAGGPDIRRWFFLLLGMWIFAPRPEQTIFWMTGAFNYMFTTTIILAFFLAYRRYRGAERTEKQAVACAGLFVLGILAGWCNENTSGAAILFVIFVLLIARLTGKDGEKASVRAGDVAALAGVGTGFLMQLLSPGNRARTVLIEERHSGILLYAARFLKVMHTTEKLLLPLILAFLFLLLVAVRQGAGWKDAAFRNALLFFVLSAACAGCLVLAPDPQERVYFGGGIFLIIAVVQLIGVVRWEGAFAAAGRDFVLLSMAVIMFFTFFEEGGNLARIFREVNARYEILAQAQAAGEEECNVPMLPEGFESRYSMAYDIDVTQNWQDFSCMQLADYYGFHVVWGTPYLEYEP